jgi:hypothetical protein
LSLHFTRKGPEAKSWQRGKRKLQAATLPQLANLLALCYTASQFPLQRFRKGMTWMEIVYELTKGWPKQGALQVTVPSMTVNIPISPDKARRRANGYLGMHVGVLLGTSEPRLLMGDRPLWKLSVNLHLPSIGYVGQVGTIQVDATTGDVIPLADSTIQQYQDRAHDLVIRFAPATEPRS